MAFTYWLTPMSAAQKRSGDVMLLSHRGKGNHKADVSSVEFLGAVLSVQRDGKLKLMVIIA